MPELNDTELLTEANHIRLAELEVEKAKIKASQTTQAQQTTWQTLIWLSAVLAFLLGGIWALYDFNLQEEMAITTRDLATAKQRVEESKQQTERNKQKTEQEKWKAEQLKALIEIVRNSNTDELALEAMRQLPKK